jgi:hypothetical protein
MIQTRFIDSIDAIPAREWNALIPDDNPFIDHAFLAALEHHGAASKANGWQPHHLIATDNGRLCGALPLYIKDHSFGEFVFDWAWANAYAQAGIPYYPKLIAAIPYTPVSGARLLSDDSRQQQDIITLLIETTQAFAAQTGLSSLHYLFINSHDKQRLDQQRLLPRYGCQFHWFNRGYTHFDDFLAALSSRHRKKIQRERRRVIEQGISITTVPGDEVSSEQWAFFHQCYQATFDKKANYAPLTAGFFQEIGQQLGPRVLLMIASQDDRPVASALFLRSNNTLFGRYWGSLNDIDCLHFELCYYQAIDYCIEHGLQRCEAGAQGEHKIGRGFTPTSTHSAHWIAHPEFRIIIERFVRHEKQGVIQYMQDMQRHLPYKKNAATPPENVT